MGEGTDQNGQRRLGVLNLDLGDGNTDVPIYKNSSCCTLKNMYALLHVLHTSMRLLKKMMKLITY